MFFKFKKHFWTAVCAIVASVFVYCGIAALPNYMADAAVAVPTGSLSEEVTLNRITAEAGITAEGTTADFIEFDGFGGNTWFMTEFVGKNAPNYAVRAIQGYSTWDDLTVKTAWYSPAGASITVSGMLICNTWEANHNAIAVYRGTNTSSSGTRRAWPDDTVSGMNRYVEGTRYIQIIGYEPGADGYAATFTTYTFVVGEDGALTMYSATATDTHSANALGGSKAVIYANINRGPESISFTYAQPATTLSALVNNLSDGYQYKRALMNSLSIEAEPTENLRNTVTFDRIAATAGITAEGTTADFIEFDGFDGNTWFITEFDGQNAPNYAVRALQGYSVWDATTAALTTAVDGYGTITPAGMLICNAWEAHWTAVGVYRGTNTSSTGSRRAWPDDTASGMSRYVAGTRYIQIIGYEVGENGYAATFTTYTFIVNADDSLTKYSVTATDTHSANALKGSKAVIYANINRGPESITFNYERPASTLGGLINNLSDNCKYKEQLLTVLSIEKAETKTITLVDSEGNELWTETASGSYTLPQSDLANFVGWAYNGKVYQAGDAIYDLSEDVTATEVSFELSLLDGASVRVSSTTEQYGGLRFTVKISTLALDVLGDSIVTTGMIVPTDLIEGEFDIAESQAKSKVLENLVAKEDGYTYGYITLTNIQYKNYNRAFSAKAYCSVTYANGTVKVYETAYNEEVHSRSIYQVSVEAWNANDSRSSTVLKEYLNNTVNIAAQRNGADGYTFVAEHENDALVDYERAYSIATQEYDATTGNATVTLNIDIAERLYESGELPAIPVTVWVGSVPVRTSVTVNNYADGVATCSFVIDDTPIYQMSDGEYTLWAYSATCDDWYQVNGGANLETDRTYFEDGTRQTPENTKLYKDAGFNVLFVDWTFNYNGVESTFATSKLKTVMDQAYAEGLKCFIFESNLHHLSKTTSSLIDAENADGTSKFVSQEALNEHVAYILREVKEHPAFYGVSLVDEAYYTMFPAMGEIYRAVQEVCPGVYVNMNLNPLSNDYRAMQRYSAEYADANEYSNYTVEQAKAAYEQYLDSYYQYIGQYCGYVQYDDYPLMQGTLQSGYHNVLTEHLLTMQTVSDFATEKGLKTQKVYQTHMYGNLRRAPTTNDMYWQMNLGIAMGMKAHSYYTYYPVPNTSDSELPDDTATIVDREGNPNELYYTIQTLQTEMQITAKALAHFTYQDLKYYTKGSNLGDTDFLNDVENTATMQYLTGVSLGSNGVVLTTELKDESLNQYGYYVVNATDSTQTMAQTVTLTFAGYSNVQVYQNGVVTNYQLIDGSITLSLACGKGAFVLPY